MNTRPLLLAALLAASPLAHAQTIGIDLISAHIPHRDRQNNVNPGVYVKFDNGLLLGTYRNTYRRQSAVAAYSLDYGRYSLLIGVVSGYQKRVEPIPCADPNNENCSRTTGFSRGFLAPVLAPSYAFPAVYGVTPRITYIPGLGFASSVFHLSLEKSL